LSVHVPIVYSSGISYSHFVDAQTPSTPAGFTNGGRAQHVFVDFDGFNYFTFRSVSPRNSLLNKYRTIYWCVDGGD
jgi:hypothetical protein